MEGYDWLEAIEEDYDVAPLFNNSSINWIETYKEKVTMKAKARACLHAALPFAIFSRIMALKPSKEIWEFLKNEYEGEERIKGMKVSNLVSWIRENANEGSWVHYKINWENLQFHSITTHNKCTLMLQLAI